MKKVIVAACLALLSVSASAEPMTRPGLWEIRMDKQVIDGQDMTARMAAMQAEMQKHMASMPPERRRQMEQAMGGQSMGGSPNTHRICISPEMAAQDKPVLQGDSRCEPTRTTRSGNKLSFEMNCPGVVGKGESLINGDTVTTRMDMTVTDASGKHTMQTESRMSFLGSDCKGIKPADQLVREMQGRTKK